MPPKVNAKFVFFQMMTEEEYDERERMVEKVSTFEY